MRTREPITKVTGEIGQTVTQGRHGKSITVATYVMNPAEDVVLFGDELANGMWVLADDCGARPPYGPTEDERLRSQRFRRATPLRPHGEPLTFVRAWHAA